jgi:hypothetical protein
MMDHRSCRGWVALVLTLVGGASACGPKSLGLHAQPIEGCSEAHRFTAVLSGNVLGFTVARDEPGESSDEIITVLSYKESAPGSHRFELIPPLEVDPLQVNDQAPAMTATVEGTRACLAPMGAGDQAGDACLASWLAQPRCYDLQPE